MHTILICVNLMNTVRNCKVMVISIRALYTLGMMHKIHPNFDGPKHQEISTYFILNHSLRLAEYNFTNSITRNSKMVDIISHNPFDLWPKVTPSNVWNSANQSSHFSIWEKSWTQPQGYIQITKTNKNYTAKRHKGCATTRPQHKLWTVQLLYYYE